VNLLDQLEGAIEQTRPIVHNTTAAQFDLPTPCGDWDVRTLLNHLIGIVKLTAARAADEEIDLSTLQQDNIGDSPGDAYATAAAAAVAGWRKRGTEGTVAFFGREAPVEVAFHIVLSDLLVHGWDLAQATGQDVTWNQELAQDRLTVARQMLKPEMRGNAFGPEVTPPEGADPMTELVAFLGRQP
jgi:uncharacterized protein (TIGR03086 family)